MCGRTIFTLSHGRVTRIAGLRSSDVKSEDIETVRSYNLCPTRRLICITEDVNAHQRNARLMKWGLEPRFEASKSLSTINARIEGIQTSRMYSRLIDANRCVVIVDAFYEWDQTTPKHTPYLIRNRDTVPEECIPPVDGTELDSGDVYEVSPPADSILPDGVAPLLLAAIYDTNPATGELSCSILTTDSCAAVAKVHTRMPVMLSAETARLWMGTAPFSEIVGPIVKACRSQAEGLFCTQVSNLVSSISNKSRDVTLPVAEMKEKSFQKGLGRFFTKSPDGKRKDDTDSDKQLKKAKIE